MNRLVSLLIILLIFRGIYGLADTCTKNSDCNTLNALCINNACICDDFSLLSNDSHCLPYASEYKAICYVPEQCEWLGDNSECRHNRCVCKENFRWYQGKCQEFVDKGEPCVSDDQCYNGYDLLSLACSSDGTDGTCECRDGYYSREFDCRKYSLESEDCALDLDCQSSELECVLAKCTKKSEDLFAEYFEGDNFDIWISSVNVLTYGDDPMTCHHDGDCMDMANSLCDATTKTCGCNVDTHYFYKGNCVRGVSPCNDDTDCSETNNTMCFKHSCICQPGFFLKDKKCVAELGMKDPHVNYKADSDCPIKPGKLVDSVCYCKNYWFNDDSNRNCIKTTIQQSLSCLTNEWCSVLGKYSFCNTTTSTCECSRIAEFNKTSYYCERISDDTDICLRDTDCDVNERCLNEKCECLEYFSRNNENVCVPNILGSCQTVSVNESSCSHIENAYCLDGVCTCAENYTGKGTKCLKIADSLESPCEEQEQCNRLPHSVCGVSDNEYTTLDSGGEDTLRCVCEEGYIDVDSKCRQIKKFGDPCMAEEDCTLVLNRSYKCRNSVCQCNVGQTLKNGYCTSAGNIILAGGLVWLAIVLKIGI